MEDREVWVKGYLSPEGDVIIPLEDGGYHKIISDYVGFSFVNKEKLLTRIMEELSRESKSSFDYSDRVVELGDIRDTLKEYFGVE